jgi:uncharacterized membrane protein (UPF0136 family)
MLSINSKLQNEGVGMGISIELARYSILIIAGLVLVGGVIGFIKAQSKASLIAGIASAIAFVLTYFLSLSNPSGGLIASFIVGLALDVVFVKRLMKTKQFMPSGLILSLCLAQQVMIVLTLTNH